MGEGSIDPAAGAPSDPPYRTPAGPPPPNAVLGTDLSTVTPGTEHQVAAALLRTRPSEKFNARIYRALFERVNRAVGELPSSHDRPPPA